MKKLLLCDFHIHATFSDGRMRPREVVDLYGINGFDAISITDHVFDAQCSHSREMIKKGLRINDFKRYLRSVKKVASYARDKYDLLVIPGLEVCNHLAGFHILGLDIKESIDPNLPADKVIKEIHRQGGLAIACHPYYKISELQDRQKIEEATLYLWKNQEKYFDLIDAWEITNQNDFYSIVGLNKLPFLASSDFHKREHLYSWKTTVLAFKNSSSIKKAIKEQQVGLALFRDERKATFSPRLTGKDSLRLAFPLLVTT